MAFTPCKDHKRREREQKKMDKRIAREEAKFEQLQVKQAEDEPQILLQLRKPGWLV